MLKEIILLTAQPQQQVAFTALLKEHNPRLSFRYALTAEDVAAFDAHTLAHSRLLAFTTGVIVPARVLNALGHGAYNFHPGSPDYPGWAPAHFALYEGAQTFGATAHVMLERVDAGPIIGVETFVIPSAPTSVNSSRLRSSGWHICSGGCRRTSPPAATRCRRCR